MFACPPPSLTTFTRAIRAGGTGAAPTAAITGLTTGFSYVSVQCYLSQIWSLHLQGTSYKYNTNILGTSKLGEEQDTHGNECHFFTRW